MDLDKLEALARAAMPGPWINGAHEVYQTFGECDRICKMMSAEDSAFIAALNPAVVLDWAELTRKQEAEIVALGNLHVVQAAAGAAVTSVESLETSEGEALPYSGAINYRYMNLDTLQYVDSQSELVRQVGKGGVMKCFTHYPKGVFIAASRSDFTEMQANLGAKKIHDREFAAPQQQAPARDLGIEAAIMGGVLEGNEVRQHAQAAEQIVQVLLYMSGNGLITWQGTGNDEDDAWNSDEEYRATLDAVRKGMADHSAQKAAKSRVTGHAQTAQPVKVAGPGSITNEDDGVLTLRFKDDDSAAAFMHAHLPTIDCRDMPRSNLVEDAQAASSDAQRQNLELVIARLEQIAEQPVRHIDTKELAEQALPCASAVLAARQPAPIANDDGPEFTVDDPDLDALLNAVVDWKTTPQNMDTGLHMMSLLERVEYRLKAAPVAAAAQGVLPSLPEPMGEIQFRRPQGFFGRVYGYHANQMRDFYQQGRAAGIELAAKGVSVLVNPQGVERHDADDPLMFDGWESGQTDALFAIRALNNQGG